MILYDSNNLSVAHNTELNGLELRYKNKMTNEEIAALKAKGFLWSRRNQNWYTRWDGSETPAKVFIDKLIDNDKSITSVKVETEKEFSKSSFSALDFLMNNSINSADIDLFTNSLTNFSKQATVIYEESLSKNELNNDNILEEHNESSKTDTVQIREGENNREINRPRDYRLDANEYSGRQSTEMGGDSRGGHTGTGYGNNLRTEGFTEGERVSTSEPNASDNNTASDGHIWESSKVNDSSTSRTILPSSLQERGLATELREHDGSAEQPRYGLKERKNIRSEVKSILTNKKDTELTSDDIEKLKLFEGGGGLNEENASTSEVLNAFYTPRNIIKKTWELIDSYNPNAKTVLEPSSGIGRFAENRPNNIFTLRELDETSSRIAKILHPEATVIQGAFQKQFFDENGIFKKADYVLPQYDIVIGNPPYGEYSGEWKGKGEGKEFRYIDEYFIARGLESVKENGSLAFVMPSGFLKRHDERLAETLAKDSILIDAWRLPNGAFPTTEVGTDIVVFKKLNEQEKSSFSFEKRKEILCNDNFFKQNPQHILGNVTTRSGRFGDVEYIEIPEGKSIDEMFSLIHSNTDYLNSYEIDKTQTASTSTVSDKDEKATAINSPITQAESSIQSKDTIESRKVTTIPYIKKSYASIFNEENKNPLFNNKAFYEKNSITNFTGDFDKLPKRFWNKGNPLSWYTNVYFDIASKSAALAIDSEDGFYQLIALVDKTGSITKLYDEDSDSYKSLTKTRKERLNYLLDEYVNTKYFVYTNKNVITLSNGFIGLKDKTAYFKDINGFHGNDIKFFDTIHNQEPEIENFKFAINNKNILQEYKAFKTNGFFAKQSSLYPKDNKDIDLKQLIEDDSIIQLAADSIDVIPLEDSEEYFKRTGTNDYRSYWKSRELAEISFEKKEKVLEAELLKVNGFSNFDELHNDTINHITSKFENTISKLEAIQKELNVDEEQDLLLNEIVKHGFKATSKDFVANNSIVKIVNDKDNKDTKNVYINYERAFAINDKDKSLTTFNNYRVTNDFVKTIYNQFGNELNVSDTTFTEEVVSLNKILLKKPAPKTKTELGKEIATVFINNYIKTIPQETSNTALKDKHKLDFNSPVFVFSVKEKEKLVKVNGTHIKLYSDIKSNYPMLDFDKKNNILKLFQESYSEGFTSSFESVFRESFTNISIIKDLTIDNQRYVDTDGNTVEALPMGKTFEPTKLELMDNKEFADVYGKNWNADERKFWEATDYQGYVDLSKLHIDDALKLKNSDNYIEERNGIFIHKELFASGDIYLKLKHNQEFFETGYLNEKSYKKNQIILNKAIPTPYKLKDINQSIISPFVENLSLDGVSFKDKFIQWATGCNLSDNENRADDITNFSLAHINREDIPATISWKDVYDYVNGIPLPRINDKDTDKIEKEKIRNQKINDRKNTAELLFNRYLQQGLSKEEEKYFLDSYNSTYNSNRIPDYSKLPLFIDGMNKFRKGKEFKLYEQQIKGISFLGNKGNGLLAYDVGVGKTAAGIVATVNQLQSGRCKKPLIIVPKSVIGKWESDIHELFPNIIVNNLGDLGIGENKKATAYYDKNHGLNIPDGSITLISKDALNNISWKKTTIDEELFSDFADLLGVSDTLYDPHTSKKVKAEITEKIYQKAGCASAINNENYILWEKTGFDQVTVDEAHNFKNLYKVPRAKKVEANEFQALGSGDPSIRALKMFNITQLIQKNNEDRNVFMLTATPFTNSPLEIYSMLTYVARKELEKKHIKNLYDFCKQYANTRLEQVVLANGDVAYKSVMKEFSDLHGLQSIINQYMDKVDGDEAGIIRPIKRTHAVHIKPTETQKEIFDYAINNIMTYKMKENEKGAPTLEAMSILRTAALSPALLNPEKLEKWEGLTKVPCGVVIPPIEEVVECSPKLKLVCDTIVKNWKKHKDAGQIIYMPEGTEAFPHVINYMIKQGVPKEVFASIDGSAAKIGGKNVTITKDDDTDDKRAKVSNCFNDKKNPCKILIGSSAISEGMDLNGNSLALYNVMLGWNPTETIQVEGRIWRQGNEQGHVHLVYPLMDDSIDSFLYQKHDEKISRINNIWNYKGSTLNVEAINPEEMKYELIKNPNKRAKIEIDQQKEEVKKAILLLDNQLKDYDQLGENRIKFNEKVAQRKIDKQEYVNNHSESIAKGNPNRNEEEQAKGLARFDKAILDLQNQLDNINRKYISLGINNSDDEHSFAMKIISKKDELNKQVNYLSSDEHFNDLYEKYLAKLNKETIEANEQRLIHPLYEEIQNDIVPMHIVEKDIKTERYNKAMENAKKENNVELQNKLTKEFDSYLEEYNNQHLNKNLEQQEEKIDKFQKKIDKQEEKLDRCDANDISAIKNEEVFDIVKIVNITTKEFIPNENYAGTLPGLFPDEEFSPKQILIDNRISSFTSPTTMNMESADNFSNRLHLLTLNTDLSSDCVLYATKKLLKTMNDKDLVTLKNFGKYMKITDEKGAIDFYTKIAKKQITLRPTKIPPVQKTKTLESQRSY